MHLINNLWLDELKKEYCSSFENRSVLELGSLDINGSPRSWFENCQYVGVDRTEGNGVDLVCNFIETKFDHGFDTIISLNALMYDKDWKNSLTHNLQWLRKGGILFVTIADNKWEGSRRKYPDNEEGEMIDIDNSDFRLTCIYSGIEILEYYYEQHKYPVDTVGGPGTFNLIGKKI